MASNIIIDAGAIVSLLDRRDQYHQWCKTESADLQYPFYTCESVLSEAFHLLESVSKGTTSLLGLLQKQVIQVNFNYGQHADAVHTTMTKYDDLPASFADACLVQMATQSRKARILTVDSDFNIYRGPGGEALSVIVPQ